jgi:polyphosphate kinase 2 (PPK2 family)
LDELDLSLRLGAEEYETRLRQAQRRLLELRLNLGGQIGGQLGPGLLVVLEGSDAGGKGGAIKRIVGPLDPRHYRVSAFSRPSSDEKRRQFLWRLTDHDLARWDLIEAERKGFARVRVLETIIARIEAGFVRWGLAVPPLS